LILFIDFNKIDNLLGLLPINKIFSA